MTPAARHAAAIEVLDAVDAGASAEQHLTRWARGARYAGSGDRAAVRDIVFDVLRCRASCAWLGQGTSGRALVLGLLRQAGVDPATVFTGQGHAPAPLDADEAPAALPLTDAPRDVQLDMPDWALAHIDADHGAEAATLATALRERAPIGVRRNHRRMEATEFEAAMAEAGFDLTPHPAAPGAYTVPAGTRGLQNLALFTEGVFEMQDPGSQGLVARLPARAGEAVLDYCAGGGGKSLALADRVDVRITAHDVDPKRMADIPVRAGRAGVAIDVASQVPVGARFDGVIADVPCTGSGAWRRAPEAKWSTTPERLAQLIEIQSDVVDHCVAHLRPGGWLGYMTCSLFDAENQAQAEAILSRHPNLRIETQWHTTPLAGTDGFYLCVFRDKS